MSGSDPPGWKMVLIAAPLRTRWRSRRRLRLLCSPATTHRVTFASTSGWAGSDQVDVLMDVQQGRTAGGQPAGHRLLQFRSGAGGEPGGPAQPGEVGEVGVDQRGVPGRIVRGDLLLG